MDEEKSLISEERSQYVQWQKEASRVSRLRRWSLLLFTHVLVAFLVWQAPVFIPILRNVEVFQGARLKSIYYCELVPSCY